MRMTTASRWLLFLCALPSLTGCGPLFPTRPAVVTRPEAVEINVPTYVAVPNQLTTPLRKPEPPPRRCVLKGRPAVCASDAIALIPIYDALLDLANQDRAKASMLGGALGK